MEEFDALYEFNEIGLRAFEEALGNTPIEDNVDPLDPHYVVKVSGSSKLSITNYSTAREMAAAILDSLGSSQFKSHVSNTGLWAWLTFVLREQLFNLDKEGNRKVGEIHRWYPSDPNDWRKSQRHLVRMPVHLLFEFGVDADHLLCSHPSIVSEVRMQLTSQQDMFVGSFQKVARHLYFDDVKGKLKPGAGAKEGGASRRLAMVKKQLDVTWDLEDLELDRILQLLPREFDKFRIS